MFNQIARRRHLRSVRLANVVRPDTSYDDLQRFRQEGYTRAIFVKSTDTDEPCVQRDGKIWNIEDLTNMWTPSEPYILFWLTHPNCLCHFEPDPQSKQAQEPEEQAQVVQTPEIPPTTMEPPPSQTSTV